MAVHSGSVTVTVTATALPAQVCKQITLDSTGASAPILVGGPAAQTFSLATNSKLTIETDNVSDIYVKVATLTQPLQFLIVS